jgi:plasmid stabilization system protein ParE
MFEKLISKLGRTLSKHEIPYMIIGGQAVLLYGSPRLTKDIDMTLGVPVDRLADMEEICRSEGLEILPENHEDFVKDTHVLPVKDQSTGIRIDFIFSHTPYEEQAIKRARRVTMGKGEAQFASVEDVIIHKIFSGRPRDLEDVRTIIVKNPDMDRSYIKKWLAEFDKTVDGANFTDSFENLLQE